MAAFNSGAVDRPYSGAPGIDVVRVRAELSFCAGDLPGESALVSRSRVPPVLVAEAGRYERSSLAGWMPAKPLQGRPPSRSLRSPSNEPTTAASSDLTTSMPREPLFEKLSELRCVYRAGTGYLDLCTCRYPKGFDALDESRVRHSVQAGADQRGTGAQRKRQGLPSYLPTC